MCSKGRTKVEAKRRGVQGTEEEPEISMRGVEEEVLKEGLIELDPVDATVFTAEVLEDAATAEFDLGFSFRCADEFTVAS